MLTKEQHKANYKLMKKNLSLISIILREIKKKSLEEVSAETGLSVKHLECLEAGKQFNFGSLLHLARYYDKKLEIRFN